MNQLLLWCQRCTLVICRIFAGLVLLGAPIYANAAVTSTKASEDLSHLLAGFHALSANFVQTTYDANQKPLQKTTGSMALSRPGKFYWSVKQPNAQVLIADSNNLWIYDVDLAQATRQKLDKNKASSPASLLSGSLEDLKMRFKVVRLDQQKAAFRLMPKASGDLFNWIELSFTDGKLASMRLSDNLGSLSVFQFSQVKLDPSLNPSLFQFKAPQGVDVIQN